MYVCSGNQFALVWERRQVVEVYLETDWDIAGFSLFMRFVDNNKSIEQCPPYPFNETLRALRVHKKK